MTTIFRGDDGGGGYGVFFFAAKTFGEGAAFHSPPAFYCLSGDQLAHANSTLYASIGPQWLSELRRLWSSVS